MNFEAVQPLKQMLLLVLKRKWQQRELLYRIFWQLLFSRSHISAIVSPAVKLNQTCLIPFIYFKATKDDFRRTNGKRFKHGANL